MKRKKALLRTHILKIRQSHHPAHKITKDEKILRRLQRMAMFKKAKTVLLFASMPDEVHTLELIKKLLPKKIVAFPKVKKSKLSLETIDHVHELEKGSFGILEPCAGKIIAPKKIDCAIIPGLAFDSKGHRLGFGKGFYDRLLKKLKCPKIGLAYEFQMVENIPVESHDVHMDFVVTEKRTYVRTQER